jgi:hypothetical protein
MLAGPFLWRLTRNAESQHMSQISTVKFIGAWVSLIAAAVLVILGHEIYALPGTLALISIAFSQAPPAWR